jgi:hypothetical protein
MATPSDTTGGNEPFVVTVQGKLLACKETDWVLPGSISTPVLSKIHGRGTGRPSFSHPKKLFIESVSCDNDSDSLTEEREDVHDLLDDSMDFEEEVEPESSVLDSKPEYSPAILEVRGFMETLQVHCCCPCCDAYMKPRISTLCLYSTIGLDCTNEMCGCLHP